MGALSSKSGKEANKGEKYATKTEVLETKRFREVYQVGDKLGEGGFGVVHECTDRQTQVKFAVKMIDTSYSDKETVRVELEMLKFIEHERCVKCIDVFEDKCFTYVVMPIYKGGDLIDGLQLHLRTKGKIAETAYLPVVKHMAIALAWIHGKGVVHRDVKGDNFLMTHPDVAHPELGVCLSDFGAATHLEKGNYLSSRAGTSIYWAPEVHRKKYDFGCDVWAMGMVFFGLVEGTYPFRDENETMNKRLRYPKTLRREIVNLLQQTLCKELSARITAKDCLKHPVLGGDGETSLPLDSFCTSTVGENSASSPRGSPRQEENNKTPAELAEGLDLTRDICPENVVLARRAKAKALEKQELRRISSGGVTQTASGSGIAKEKFKAKNFSCPGKNKGMTLLMEWWPKDRCVKTAGLEAVDPQALGVPFVPISANEQRMETEDAHTKEILLKFGVDLTKFGQGTAKTLANFVEELRVGEAVLAEDSKRILRVVDTVIVRLEFPKFKEALLLVEKAEELADARRREVTRLPGTKRRAAESARETALRVCTDLLKLQPEDVELGQVVDMYDEEEESPSYPGVFTVYRKEVFHGTLVCKDPARLKKVGLPKGNGFITEVSDVSTSHAVRRIAWGWLSETKCKKAGVKLGGTGGTSRYAGLVPATMTHLTGEMVKEKFEQFGFDCSLFGVGVTRTFQNIAQEIVLGECDLLEENGQLVREVQIVVVRLREPGGQILVQTGHDTKDKAGDLVHREQVLLPGLKQRPHENPFHTARRVVTSVLGFEDDQVAFDMNTSFRIEEVRDSSSYAGLRTIYRKNVIDAQIVQ